MSSSKKKKPASTGPKKPRKKPVDDGIPKKDKAAVTRFCRDVLKDPEFAAPHLSVPKIKKAIMANVDINKAIVDHGSVVWRMNGFTSALTDLLETIPKVMARRKKMSPEERAEFNDARRDALIETAQGRSVNAHSLAALKIAYLQGLKAEERAAAKEEFERSIGA